MKIADDTVVVLTYNLTDADGQVLDTSTAEEPFSYLHGHSGIIPGLEQELAGREAGEAFKLTIEPADAYGERNEEMVSVVPRNLFQGVDTIEVGMSFNGESDQGTHTVTVIAVDDETVTIDANAPLAGVQLTFDVEVLEVRAASAEELEHGHAHGPGGVHH